MEVTRPERYIDFPCPKFGASQLIRTIPGARCTRCGAAVVAVRDGGALYLERRLACCAGNCGVEFDDLAEHF